MHDVAVIGAGAAGITAALAARGALDAKGGFRAPAAGPRVLLLDGEERPGRKILVSGGGRCNVTNGRVTDGDFASGAPHVVRGLLAGFPPASIRALLEARGVPLREEPLGKLFPAAGGARAVLEALLGAVREAGVECRFGEEVASVERAGEGWTLDGRTSARRVVLATGGLSMPATGSRGFGYALAERVGHRLVPAVPALTPLLADTPETLAGITVPAILSLADDRGRILARTAGSLLFTHRGVSGPAALDLSLAVERQAAEGPYSVRADLWTMADPAGPFGPHLSLPKPPGACLPEAPPPAEPSAVERLVVEAARRDPRRALGGLLGERLPRRLVEALVPAAGRPLARVTREERREAAAAVASFDLRVRGTEGFAKAEVTAGGVDLAELDRRTLESRPAPGLFVCGEVCDATGRLGGFNFQWAWSSGFAAGRGAAAG